MIVKLLTDDKPVEREELVESVTEAFMIVNEGLIATRLQYTNEVFVEAFGIVLKEVLKHEIEE